MIYQVKGISGHQWVCVECVRVCASVREYVRGCVQVWEGVHGYARVCAGVHRCVWICMGVGCIFRISSGE